MAKRSMQSIRRRMGQSALRRRAWKGKRPDFPGCNFAGKWDQTGRADIRRIAVSAGRDYARQDCGFNGNFFQLLVPSVFQLIQMYKDFRGAEPVVRNVLQVIEEEEEEPVVYERRDIEDHLILLQQLSFSYGDKPVLSQIDMTIPVTGSIAIKGMSGEGKSTLLKVISGLYG